MYEGIWACMYVLQPGRKQQNESWGMHGRVMEVYGLAAERPPRGGLVSW